jgi:hypothetical protein
MVYLHFLECGMYLEALDALVSIFVMLLIDITLCLHIEIETILQHVIMNRFSEIYLTVI